MVSTWSTAKDEKNVQTISESDADAVMCDMFLVIQGYVGVSSSHGPLGDIPMDHNDFRVLVNGEIINHEYVDYSPSQGSEFCASCKLIRWCISVYNIWFH
ncbi:hypothetical protein PR048_001428 [Dryococelus australis]|uniref:Uncharacterized protein n=1 Tax=Dryococelus australis TaxID=614101 RepID=A0ABQ9IHG8_9NEOP|nr:hypothetical protein PR048_001428 [Dryococelus australis]